jgi:hypothetical protein
LYADASTVVARWNWWGALAGPQGKGDHLSAVNHGRINYAPWKLFPVLFAGVMPSALTNRFQHQGINPWLIVPFGSRFELGQGDCNEHHGLWDGKVTMEFHSLVSRNKVRECMSLLLPPLTEMNDEKH